MHPFAQNMQSGQPQPGVHRDPASQQRTATQAAPAAAHPFGAFAPAAVPTASYGPPAPTPPFGSSVSYGTTAPFGTSPHAPPPFGASTVAGYMAPPGARPPAPFNAPSTAAPPAPAYALLSSAPFASANTSTTTSANAWQQPTDPRNSSSSSSGGSHSSSYGAGMHAYGPLAPAAAAVAAVAAAPAPGYGQAGTRSSSSSSSSSLSGIVSSSRSISTPAPALAPTVAPAASALAHGARNPADLLSHAQARVAALEHALARWERERTGGGGGGDDDDDESGGAGLGGPVQASGFAASHRQTYTSTGGSGSGTALLSQRQRERERDPEYWEEQIRRHTALLAELREATEAVTDAETAYAASGAVTAYTRSKLASLRENVYEHERALQRFSRAAAEARRRATVASALTAGYRGDQAGETESAIAHFARERDGLRQVSSVLDDATGLARSSLDSLYRQRDILKGVHQKMIGVAASLGVSQNVLRAIERKETFNAMLTYGGMVLTLVVVWLFYRYWTGK